MVVAAFLLVVGQWPLCAAAAHTAALYAPPMLDTPGDAS
jgi:hypothetical protein